jgi:hypothetical protein
MLLLKVILNTPCGTLEMAQGLLIASGQTTEMARPTAAVHQIKPDNAPDT